MDSILNLKQKHLKNVPTLVQIFHIKLLDIKRVPWDQSYATIVTCSSNIHRSSNTILVLLFKKQNVGENLQDHKSFEDSGTIIVWVLTLSDYTDTILFEQAGKLPFTCQSWAQITLNYAQMVIKLNNYCKGTTRVPYLILGNHINIGCSSPCVNNKSLKYVS